MRTYIHNVHMYWWIPEYHVMNYHHVMAPCPRTLRIGPVGCNGLVMREESIKAGSQIKNGQNGMKFIIVTISHHQSLLVDDDDDDDGDYPNVINSHHPNSPLWMMMVWQSSIWMDLYLVQFIIGYIGCFMTIVWSVYQVWIKITVMVLPFFVASFSVSKWSELDFSWSMGHGSWRVETVVKVPAVQPVMKRGFLNGPAAWSCSLSSHLHVTGWLLHYIILYIILYIYI